MTSRHLMLRALTIPALLLMAACQTESVTTENLGLSGPVVQSQLIERRHSVYFDTDSHVLSDRERLALRRFAMSSGSASSGNAARSKIRVLGHADERASDGYNLSLSARRAKSVARELLQVVGSEVDVSYFGERAPAAIGSNATSWKRNRRVDVVVEDYVVRIPGCATYSDGAGPNRRNALMTGIGCANAANLASMVANPADLAADRPVLPVDRGLADPPHSSAAIERYRIDKVKEPGKGRSK